MRFKWTITCFLHVLSGAPNRRFVGRRVQIEIRVVMQSGKLGHLYFRKCLQNIPLRYENLKKKCVTVGIFLDTFYSKVLLYFYLVKVSMNLVWKSMSPDRKWMRSSKKVNTRGNKGRLEMRPVCVISLKTLIDIIFYIWSFVRQSFLKQI